MKSNIILADFSNFSSHGGAEKNGYQFVDRIEPLLDAQVLRIESRTALRKWLLKAILRNQRPRAILTFKGSALTSLLFRMAGVQIISRVNNSPEAYLYWRGLKSVVSFWLRIRSLPRDILIFNSLRVMDFYQTVRSGPSKMFYLPNAYAAPDIRARSGEAQIFVASRISWEKNFEQTYALLKSISEATGYKAKGYSSSENVPQETSPFTELNFGFNDIYVSMSFFEGMPNMAVEAILQGAGVVLSNCWAHGELALELRNAGLEDRVLITSGRDKEIFRNDLRAFSAKLSKAEIEVVRAKTQLWYESLATRYDAELDAIAKTINQ